MHYYRIDCSYNKENKRSYYISSENKLKPDSDGYIPLPVTLVEKLWIDGVVIDNVKEINYDEWVLNQLGGVGYLDVK